MSHVLGRVTIFRLLGLGLGFGLGKGLNSVFNLVSNTRLYINNEAAFVLSCSVFPFLAAVTRRSS